MKKTRSTKLGLSHETLRRLDTNALPAVAAGLYPTYSQAATTCLMTNAQYVCITNAPYGCP